MIDNFNKREFRQKRNNSMKNNTRSNKFFNLNNFSLYFNYDSNFEDKNFLLLKILEMIYEEIDIIINMDFF